MKNAKNVNCIERECFGNMNGKCDILNDVPWSAGCPFFKTEEQVKAERERSKQIHKLLHKKIKVQI